MFTRLVVTALELKLILAIFAKWTVSFPGIGEFGRKLLVVLLLIAAAVATSTLSVGVTSSLLVAAMKIVIIVNRSANVGFSLFLLLLLVFFRKFGGPVAPNLRRITAGMAAYVTANSLSYFVMTSSKPFWIASALLPAVTITTVVYWFFSITAAGQIQPEISGDSRQWQEAEEMNRQMQKLADAVTLMPRGARRD
jgi:hypothetical protein